MTITNPSLNWPPIYRQFLTGGVERFQLTRASLALLLAYSALLGLAVPVALALGGRPAGPQWPWLLLLATLQAVLVAALAARWLGDRAGRLAGLLQLTMACLFLSTAGLSDALFCLVFSLAMGAFMMTQVPGCGPSWSQPPLRWTFSWPQRSPASWPARSAWH